MPHANSSFTSRRGSGESKLDDLTKEIYSLRESGKAAPPDTVLKIVELNNSSRFKNLLIFSFSNYSSKLLDAVLDFLGHIFSIVRNGSLKSP